MTKILRPAMKALLIFILTSAISGVAFGFTPAFYRAINLNGAALTIDGNSWVASSGAANFSFSQTGGGTFANQSVTLVPSTDANRAAMIRSSIYGSVNLNVSSVPSGNYDVYLYVWEDNNNEVYSISIEGTTVRSNYNSGTTGHWEKLGPYRTTMTDGTINVSTTGGSANLSGIEIWTADNPPAVSSPIPDHTAIIGEPFNYTVPSNTFSDPDAGTTLTYTATLSNGSALPAWLSFNTSTRVFTGTPAAGNAGTISVRVIASDGELTANDNFDIVVANGFYRALNLNGAALTIDGNSWEASGSTTNFSYSHVNGGTFANQSVTLSPSTDANRQTMIRSSIYGNVTLNVTSVPNGTYDISLYNWEDNNAETFSIAIEGTTVVSNFNSGAAGSWRKLGPYRLTISDGAINVVTSGGSCNLSGIDIRRAGTGQVLVSQVSVTPNTLLLAVNEASRLVSTVTPANATNPSITWSSANTSVATVDATGLVRAIGSGTTSITATSVDGGFTGTSNITVTSVGSNALLNPEFDLGMNNWLVNDFTGLANTFTAVQGADLSGANSFKAHLVSTSSTTWHMSIRNKFAFRLEQGRTYRISLQAKASVARGLAILLYSESTSTFYWNTNASITTAAQKFSYEYTVSQSSASSQPDFTLQFELAGGVASDLWIDNVRIEDITGITPVTAASTAPTTLSLVAGQTGQLTSTITPANATNAAFTWNTSNPSVATVNGSGLVTAVAPGSASVYTYTTNGGYIGTTAVTVAANIPVTGINISPSTLALSPGQTGQLTKTILPANATNQNVNWTSDNTSVATVNGSGLVTAVGVGSATIRGTTVSGSFTNTSSVTVAIPVAGVSVSPSTVTLNAGATSQLSKTITPSNATNQNVNWSSSNTAVATVDATGLVTGVTAGTVTITAITVSGGFTSTSTITVNNIPVTGISVSPTTLSLSANQTGQLTPTVTPANATNQNVTWSSGNTAVATVSNTGLVTAVASGQTTITVMSVSGSFTATSSVTVGAPVTGITVSPAAITLAIGQTSQLTKNIIPANATNQNVVWSSANTSVATVSNTGLVTTIATGSTTITVTTAEGSFTKQSVITVEAAPSLSSILSKWAFGYKYDGRKRMTHKKVPGADTVYMVYDDRDRLVMTQDANQRVKATPEWTFTKYDVFNRPVLTGIFKDTHQPAFKQEGMQAAVNTYYTANLDKFAEVRGTAVHGYTNQSFPSVTTENDYLAASYYDDYSYTGLLTDASAYEYDENQLTDAGEEIAQDPETFDRVQGLMTASKIKNLDTDEWMWSVNYYDDHYRVIQAIAQNNKGGLDKTTNVYDFTGKVIRTKTNHGIPGAIPITTTRKFTYDHGDRLLQTDYKMDEATSFIIAKNEYNELGQLVTKKLHGDNTGEAFKQNVDYRYNIRGWLTRINNADLNQLDGGPKDLFGMDLAYNNNIGVGDFTPQYNGNINAIKYSTNQGLGLNIEDFNEPTQRGYSFTYDPMNRLTEATHKENILAWASSDSYHEGGLTYDLNGNIQHLNRKGKEGTAMDNLTYRYTGNQLLSVADANNATEGFKDGNTSGDDYGYDGNGNMIVDRNKSISLITYNHLNLPDKVTKVNGEYIKYIYTATGVKLRQEVYNSSNVIQKKTDYLGEYFYENDTLKFINHEEGRIVMADGTPEYQYMLKDHLGNNRLTFTTKAQTDTFTATMEVNTQTEEQAMFSSYNHTTNDLLDHTDAGSTYDQALVLNGGYNGQIGLAKSFSVVPGDTIRASVYAKYISTTGPASNLANLATALTQAFGLTPGIPGEAATAFEALNTIGSVLASAGRDDDDEAAPKAFLNILIFDKDYNLVDFGYDQVDADAVQGSGTKAPHDLLENEVMIRQAGYVYVFLSNEGAVEQQVGFDDMLVEHGHSSVVQQDEYYPFGLTFNSYQRESSMPNQYQYNGKELQVELNLAWLDFGARMYMPDIGRWGVVDQHADNYFNFSPYSHCLGNPINYTDPDGRDVIFSVTRNKAGEITGVNVSSTIYITGEGATEGRADELNAASPGQFKSNTVNGVNVSFDIKYKFAKSVNSKDLKAGENVLNFVNKEFVPEEPEGRSHVDSYYTEKEKSNGIIERKNFTGRYGEIYKNGWNNNHTIFHESLHFTGLSDRYYEHGQAEGQENPMEGFENDIMGSSSFQIGYDHYKAYYDRVINPGAIRKNFKSFLNRGVVDEDSRGNLIPPSKRQISEQKKR